MFEISHLDNILADLPIAMPPGEDPNGWLDATRRHVLATLQLVGEEETTFLRAPIVHLRLLIYTFAHVKICSGNSPALANLKTELLKWSEYDSFTQLISYHPISLVLSKYLAQYRGESHDCSAAFRVKKLVDLDLTSVAAQISVILHNYEHNVYFFSQKGTRAQALLDLMQELLDMSCLDSRLRSPIVNAIVKLSEKSSLYPKSLILRDVQRQGSAAVTGGGFGDIWRGRMNGDEIAIKVMRVLGSHDVGKLFKSFSHEAVLWRQLRHPNVLPFCGVYHWDVVPPRICLISPWMINGNIIQYLEHYPHVDRVSLLCDIARGLQYLHSVKPRIIHGDLKGANILITTSRRACIGDFGLSKIANDSGVQSAHLTPSGGTLRWQAPELLKYEDNGSGPRRGKGLATDTYAFGCVCYEVFTGSPPFHELTNELQVLMKVVDGGRPLRPAAVGLDDAMWGLISLCWDQEPVRRPSASDIVQNISLKVLPTTRLFPITIFKTAPDIGASPRCTTITDSPDLTRVVACLAEGIRNSMIALYTLQKAAIDASIDSSRSCTLLDDIENSRKVLRAEWERIIRFLQQCYNCLDDHISAMEQKVGSCDAASPLRHIPALLKDVYREAQEIKERHETVQTWFKQHGAHGTARLKSRGAHARLPDLDSALDQIITALGDVLVLGRDHMDQLLVFSKRDVAHRLGVPETSSLIDTWKASQLALRHAMSSISISSGAVTVNAVARAAKADTARVEARPLRRGVIGWLRRILRFG